VSEPLVVHLNRGGIHEVEPAVETHEVTGDFGVALRNHGQAVHVHLKPEGPLADAVAVGEPNPFVGTETTETVPVRVADGVAPVEGRLAVVAGYGEQRESVAVSVRQDDDPPEVEAATDAADDDDPSDGPAATEGPMTVRLAVFFGAAVLLAAVAVLLAPSPGVGLAAAAVLAVVVVAVALAVQ
jgi:hypothetical protein